jgi:hypothetical protein
VPGYDGKSPLDGTKPVAKRRLYFRGAGNFRQIWPLGASDVTDVSIVSNGSTEVNGSGEKMPRAG